VSLRSAMLTLASLGLVLAVTSCTIDIPNPLATGTPFIVKGTSALRDVFGKGQCPVWVADTGILYHLFQGDNVNNADFDAVLVTGVTSRLRIAVREDLEVACKLGEPVVVEEILQIVR
jgi:hypothetical protein